MLSSSEIEKPAGFFAFSPISIQVADERYSCISLMTPAE
ncbi:hypothetical protein EPIR_2724 [Erwinia piriflorinigrans CFBP 5888]|uniref:Uncharacterized protein n=1 Tax=Erwinia piriflorinigrans CFBP 5888 TaxID=1161919 RepID=V5ZAN1_9GAMM|nr:hypothetical protein EPIR_2724 [Erwinia piriflorinigrans CFBP 5888]